MVENVEAQMNIQHNQPELSLNDGVGPKLAQRIYRFFRDSKADRERE
jgi:ERCC4-type nuclease